jgi:hypothetical protein
MRICSCFAGRTQNIFPGCSQFICPLIGKRLSFDVVNVMGNDQGATLKLISSITFRKHLLCLKYYIFKLFLLSLNQSSSPFLLLFKVVTDAERLSITLWHGKR